MFLALSRRQETFLHDNEWMNGPWVSQHKTWRDRLHDLAIRFSAILADLTPQHTCDNASNQILEILGLETELRSWRSSWVGEAHPGVAVRCDCCSSAPFSCICSVPVFEFPTIEFGLLQVECWTIQLLISTMLNDLAANRADWLTCSVPDLALRSSKIASQMEAANNFYAANRSTDKSSGIAEDVCRMIMPLWALKEYREKTANIVE